MLGWWRCVLAILAVLAPLHAAHARDLVVGVEAIDYTPVYGMRGGEFVGAGREILDAFARDQGHRLTYRPFPVKRLLAELIHGGIDLKFPDSPDWQGTVRQGVPITYSKPVIAYVDGTVVRAERVGAAPDSVLSLGTVAGFTPFAWQDRIKAGKVSLTENPGFEALLKQLQIGRIDGAYANVAVTLAAAEAVLGNPGALAYAPGLPHIADSYRLSSRKSPEIIAEFDEWLGRNDKLVAEIIRRTGAERGIH